MESWMWILAGSAILALVIAGFIRFRILAGKRQEAARQTPEKEMAVIKNICRNKLLRSGSDSIAEKN